INKCLYNYFLLVPIYSYDKIKQKNNGNVNICIEKCQKHHDKEHIDPIYKSSKICFKYFYSKRDRMRMKNYDYKAKMNRNRKRLAKQVAGIAIATTFTLSTPIAPSSIEDSSFKNVLSSSVVHAAWDNLLEFDTLYTGSFDGTQ